MLQLPESLTPKAVISFWIGWFIVASMVLVAVHWFHPLSSYLVGGFGAGSLLVATILVSNPMWLGKPYTLYNSMVRRILIPLVRQWVLNVVFYLVLYANRPYGKQLQAAAPDGVETMWHTKTISNLMCRSGANDVVIDEVGRAGWLSALVGWMKQPSNWWMLGLIPFLFLLSVIGDGHEETSVVADTYTLY
jgi:hypothetical protein